MGEFTKLRPELEELANKLGTSEGKAAEGAAKEEKGLFGKTMDALGAPQRYMSEGMAKVAGLAPAATSEENFANLVDKGASALGIPEGSVAGNIAKAGAVAAAEVFGDPLALVPLGKIAKYAGEGVKGLRELPALGRMLETGSKLKNEVNIAALRDANKAKVLQELATNFKEPMQMVSGESSKATETYKKLMAARAEQEAAPTLARKATPDINKMEMEKHMVEAQKAMDTAIAQGVPPERQNAFVKTWLRARGIK